MSKKKRPQSEKQSPSPDASREPGAEPQAPLTSAAPPMPDDSTAIARGHSPTASRAPTTEKAPTEGALAADSDSDSDGKDPLTQPQPVKAEREAVKTDDGSAGAIFQAKTTLRQDAFSKIIFGIKDQKTLFDAFLVALSFHVVMFPVLWFAGWALPWPKPPVVTTIVEFDLDQWLKSGKPKKVFEFRDPELNQ